MKDEWWSYGPVAEAYQQVSEGLYFARPAGDLVSLLRLAPGARVLDVGTGTGAVAARADEAVGPEGLVVGVDPAVGMLLRARRHPRLRLVAAQLPQLPHRPATFDAVVAAFVLTHVPDHAGALEAMAGVLRPGGRMGVATWSQNPSATPPGEVWQAVVKEFAHEEDVRAAMRTALPWEDAYGDRSFLEAAMAECGLKEVEIQERSYAVEMPTRSFIDSRLLAFSARFLEATLEHRDWERFMAEVSRRLTGTFGARVQVELGVNLGVGTWAS